MIEVRVSGAQLDVTIAFNSSKMLFTLCWPSVPQIIASTSGRFSSFILEAFIVEYALLSHMCRYRNEPEVGYVFQLHPVC
jgi:hypothetical protein